jgi:hypothetical protein
MILLGELQFYGMSFKNVSIAYPQKVSSEQPFLVVGRFWQPISEKFSHSGGHRAPHGFKSIFIYR